jgi:hypothetical protein
VKPIKNVAGSVHQRLLNVAKQTSRPFNEIVQYYAIERWLYRLARSDYRERIRLFLQPVATALANRKPFDLRWQQGGPWQA